MQHLDFIRYVIRDPDRPRYLNDNFHFVDRRFARVYTTFADAASILHVLRSEGRDGIIEQAHLRFPEFVTHAGIPTPRPGGPAADG